MAVGSRTTNTFVEELAKFMGTIANMKLMADADLPFLIDMETKVIEKVRGQEAQAQGAGQIPSPQMNPVGNMAMGLPGLGGIGLPSGPGAAPPPSMLGAGTPGVGSMPPMPQSNADVMALMPGMAA